MAPPQLPQWIRPVSRYLLGVRTWVLRSGLSSTARTCSQVERSRAASHTASVNSPSVLPLGSTPCSRRPAVCDESSALGSVGDRRTARRGLHPPLVPVPGDGHEAMPGEDAFRGLPHQLPLGVASDTPSELAGRPALFGQLEMLASDPSAAVLGLLAGHRPDDPCCQPAVGVVRSY